MKHLIIIGSVYPEGFIEDIKNKCSYIDYAADNFQRALLKGFDAQIDEIEFISYPVFRAKPHKLIKREKNVFPNFLSTKVTLYETGFLNLPILKKIDETLRVYRKLKSLLKDTSNTVFVYGLHSPFLLCVFLLKKKIQRASVIIPDLPEFMGGGSGFLFKIAKKIDRIIINKCLDKIDCFAVLSPYMREHLPIHCKPSVVIEGIYSDFGFDNKDITKSAGKNLLYTGLISERYGVFDLIEAFTRIKIDGFSLWLCGVCRSLQDKQILNDYISKDKRIKYYGSIPPTEARLLQKKASLLVNPRHSNEDYTKYSFPSKTMEYLASGTPTLMCKLPAIPQEYDDFLFYFTDESVDGFASKIIEILKMDKDVLKQRGINARNFILCKKNEIIQTAKIVDILFD